MSEQTENTLSTIELATELTAAWLGNPNTRVEADAVPAFLAAIHAAIVQLGAGTGSASAAPDALPEGDAQHTPAVTARKSLASPERIISMIDGKPYRTLRRHLSTNGLTPDEYRARYNLKPDYPMVAPAYSEARRAMAKKVGLGRKPASPPPSPAPEAAAPKPRGRKPGVAAKS